MGLTGAATGAAQSLEDIVAQRMLRAKLEQAISERNREFGLEQQRASETATQNEYERKRTDRIDAENTAARTAKSDTEATARRGRSNMAGVLSMGLDPETAKREMAVSSLNSGASIPDGVMEALTPPKKKEYTYTDPKTGSKSLRYSDGGEGPIDLGREPDKPQASPKAGVHVINGKLVDDSGKVVYDGGGAAGGPSPYASERNARTVDAVDDIVGSVNRWSAGYGSLLKGVPESDALNLKSKLDTLKANIAFNELTQMREASKTGGALGSIAVRELELLESTLGSLDQAQSPAQLVENLKKVKDSAERWRSAQGGTPAPSHAPTGGPDPKTRAAELIKKYRSGGV